MAKIKSIALASAVLCLSAFFANAQSRITHNEYIERYRHLALENQEIYGIPASITMAQGLLESDCGNSRLAIQANNHFGIKCKSNWTGESILHDDDAPGECFRKYSSAEESFKDHSEFLDNSARYQQLFTLEPTDYRGWAHGLKAAGYATNPRYAELLIKLIEDHQLYLLDAQAEGITMIVAQEPSIVAESPDPVITDEMPATGKIDIDNYVVATRSIDGRPVYYNNGSEFTIARENDTYEKISAVSGVAVKKLRKFNDVEPTAQPKAGDQVYLQAKSKKATNGKLIHIVKDGETMHSISQAYGIKLKRLAQINRRDAHSRLTPGQQIRLL